MTAFNKYFFKQYIKQNKVQIILTLISAVILSLLINTVNSLLVISALTALFLQTFVQQLHLESKTIKVDLIENDKNSDRKIKEIFEIIKENSRAKHQKINKNIITLIEDSR